MGEKGESAGAPPAGSAFGYPHGQGRSVSGRGGPGRRAKAASAAATYSPLYEWSPLNQSDPEYVTITIPNATTSSSAAGRPAHER
jgi:hypothetical protein